MMVRRIIPALLLLLSLAASLFVAWHFGAEIVDMAAAHAAEWRQGGANIFVAFILAQMLVAGFGFLPASLTALAMGYCLGPLNGFAVAGLGTLAGAALSFSLARSTLRPLVLSALRRWHFTPPSEAAEGVRFVCLLRLSPILPFAPASFALGVMGVRWRDFLIGTLASLPSLAAYVWIGAATPVLTMEGRSLSHPLLTALFWIGLALTALLAVQWGRSWVTARGVKVAQ